MGLCNDVSNLMLQSVVGGEWWILWCCGVVYQKQASVLIKCDEKINRS